jgi:glycosidase
MPDLNLRNAAVRDELKRLAERWLRRGIDGFRLDATRHLIEAGPGAGQSDSRETHDVLREFAAHVRRVRPDAILVGENWTDTPTIAEYFGSSDSVARGDELPSNFNFPLAAALLEGIRTGDASGAAGVLREMKRLYPAGALDAPFLTNHDMIRVGTQLRGGARLGLAAAALLTLPGVPFLYYGEEVGMQNGEGNDDRLKRTPMPWNPSSGGGFTAGTPWFPFAPGKDRANVAAQAADSASLLSRYRSLIRTRRAHPALRAGTLSVLTPDTGATPVLAFTRQTGGERLLVVHNFGDRPATAGPYDLGAASRGAIALTPVFLDAGVGSPQVGADRVTVELPPYATGMWRVEARNR